MDGFEADIETDSEDYCPNFIKCKRLKKIKKLKRLKKYNNIDIINCMIKKLIIIN